MEKNSNIIDNLNWRYATKKFDSDKKISEIDLNELLEVLRISPSSFGLQPWKFIVVENKELREKIKIAAWNQSQVTDASHLIVLCAKKDITSKDITHYIEEIAKKRGISAESLKGFEDMMVGFRNNLDKEKTCEWSKKQVYLAEGFLLSACAMKKIDACPMEGFNPMEVNKILELENKELTSVLLCPIGYRANDDSTANYIKVRFDTKEIIEFI